MHPEIGLKCCSGPIFFKTPPTLKNDEQYHVVMAIIVIFTKSPKCKQKFSKIQNFFFQISRLTLGYIPCHENIKSFFIGSVKSKRLSKKIRLMKMANFTKNHFYPLELPQVIFHQNGVNTKHTGGSRCGSTPTHVSTPRTQFSPLTDFL